MPNDECINELGISMKDNIYFSKWKNKNKVNQERLTIRMFSLLSIFIVSEKVTQENLFSPHNEK